MHRFFIAPEFIQNGAVHVINEDLIHQMTRVLRMQVGTPCIFLDNSGKEYHCTVKELAKKTGTFSIQETHDITSELPIELTLFQAIPKKPETFELILQKGTELGVKSFVPIVTDFCNRRELYKIERLGRIIAEAAEQSERGYLPGLEPATGFKEAITQNKDTAILFHSRDTQTTLKEYLSKNTQLKKCSIFIGPEGGFSPGEIEFAVSLNVPIISLGNRILRTETASIVAVGCITLFSKL